MLRRTFQSTPVRRAILTGVTLTAIAEVTTHVPSQTLRRTAFYHSLTDQVVTPALRAILNPEQAHDLAIRLAGLSPLHRTAEAEARVHMSQELWPGRVISNPIGLAAGFDKDGVAIAPLLDLGFGFVEIGSVTLKPQPGNPSPRMFRLLEDQAIINRYGFNSAGADQVQRELQAFRDKQEISKPSLTSTRGLVGVNLGKNKTSDTPLQDYQAMIRQLGPWADYLVINVSSPNTPGLRDLQASTSLEHLLKGCLETRNQLHSAIPEASTSSSSSSSWPSTTPPLLIKLSPDLSEMDLRDICQVLVQVKVDGIILTNTTTDRPESLQSTHKHEAGGLSGRPLHQRSTDCIRKVYEWTNGEIPIIGVGGIFTAQDAYDKIRAGASAVQIYSGMVYRGPGMVSKLRNELATLLQQKGHSSIREAVGLDHKRKTQHQGDPKKDPHSVSSPSSLSSKIRRWWA